MFTAAACIGIAIIGWLANRENQKDPPAINDQDLQDLARHNRQDLRLIVWLLAAILVALGIIADRIH